MMIYVGSRFDATASTVRRGPRPLAVEIIGPAAAGKSSLLQALRERGLPYVLGMRPPKSRHAWSAITLLPTFVALHREARGTLWKEMKRIAYLRTLGHAVERHGRSRSVVLDQGPVYMLARLGVHGGAKVRTHAFRRWWRVAVAEWAMRLDLLIWLDAPNEILIARMRHRLKNHRLRDAPDELVERFLNLYRATYGDLVDALMAKGAVRLLRFRTDREPLSRLADRVARELTRGGLY